MSFEFTSHAVRNCSVCGSSKLEKVREIFDDRYGQPDLFSIIECGQCNHLMTSPRIEELSLGSLYGAYYPRKYTNTDDISASSKEAIGRFSRLLRWWLGVDNQGQYSVRSGEVMLDIGCGSGLSLLEARAMGAEVRGVEADPNVGRIAKELNLKIHIGSVLDEPFSGEQFDLITLNQVIEHVPEPDQLLLCIRKRLKPKGRVVLVFPNVNSIWCRLFGNRWINWHAPYHLHHFRMIDFMRLAQKCGYSMVRTRTITPNVWTVMQIRTFRNVIRRGMPSTIWSVSNSHTALGSQTLWHQRLNKRLWRFAYFILVYLLIPIGNRIVDLMGRGDSIMVEINPVKIR